MIVPKGIQVEPPLHVLFVSTQDGEQATCSLPRLFVVLERGASATLVEEYQGRGRYLTCAVTEVVVRESARLNHARIQRESPGAHHFSALAARLGKDAQYDCRTIAFGARLSRSTPRVAMAEPGASLVLDGLALLGDTQVADTHSFIDHLVPGCTSRQVHKVIADDAALAVFNGIIYVRKDAQATDAQQQCRGLLLSTQARVDAKPQLEIYADDVKCAHGAAIGQLDPEALFYLQSRGLRPALARTCSPTRSRPTCWPGSPCPASNASSAPRCWPGPTPKTWNRSHDFRRPLPPLGRGQDPPGFPGPVHSLPRQAADLPGQRRERAHPPAGDRAHDPLPVLRAHQCAPGGLHPQPGGHRPVRGGPGEGAGLHHAPSAAQVIWTRGTTESINLVAQTFGRARVGAGDEILLSAMEHHSDIVPWQILAQEKGAKIRVIPMDDAGELILDGLEELITDRTRILGVTHVSNVLGTINPVKEIIRRAHAKGVPVLVDGAQGAPHLPVDVVDLDADFYAFSGHKMSGPTGIGVLYGRKELLDAMPPWQGGGSMILSVTWEKTTYCGLPSKFEAGTPAIAQAIGLGAAVDYLKGLGWSASPPTSTTCWPTPPTAAGRSPGCASSATPGTRPASCPSSWTTSTPTTSVPSLIMKE